MINFFCLLLHIYYETFFEFIEIKNFSPKKDQANFGKMRKILKWFENKENNL